MWPKGKRATTAQKKKLSRALKKYYRKTGSSAKCGWKRVPLELRKSKLHSRYGIRENDYQAILKKQNGLCAICYRDKPYKQATRTNRLFIDHDHLTGIIRGLLCNRCNTLLGLLEDGKLLTNVQHYLGDKK